MAFTTEDMSVKKLMAQVVYSIPRNQRKYVWTTKNWKEMYDDIVFSTNEGAREHFFGSIVLKREKEENGLDSFSIIDGQQRTITILLLLVSVEQLFKERKAKPQFDGLQQYLLSKDLNSNEHVKVLSEFYTSLDSIVKSVCDWDSPRVSLRQLLQSAETVSGEKCLADCVSFFYNRLSPLETDLIEKIRTSLLQSRLVSISATSDEDAYTVFEILNARGQVLEDYELLKNHIMRYIQPESRVDTVKIRWHENVEKPLGKYLAKFVQHYVSHYFPVAEQLSPYETIKLNTDPASVEKLLDDLCLKARYYKKLIASSLDGEDSCSSIEYQVFRFLYSSRGELFRPILLSLMQQVSDGKLTTQKYERTLLFILHFFICYNVLGRETSNKISEMVQKYAYALSNSYSDSLHADFIESMIKRLPTAADFERTFISTVGWSHTSKYFSSSDKKRVQTALDIYEKILSNRDDIYPFTIEHILPDSDNKENANIGNLIPLEEKLNERCKALSIEKKIPIYKESSFASARKFAERYESAPDTFSISTRAKEISTAILKRINYYKNLIVLT